MSEVSDIKDGWLKLARHAQARSSPTAGKPFSSVKLTIVTDEKGDPICWHMEVSPISPKRLAFSDDALEKTKMAATALIASIT